MLTPKHPRAGSAAGTAATGVVYGNIIDEAHDQLEEKYAPGDEEDALKDAEDNNSVTSDASSHPEVVKSLIRTGTIGTAAAVAVAAAAAASATQRRAARDKGFFKMTLDLEIEEAGEPGSTKRKLFERDVINGKP